MEHTLALVKPDAVANKSSGDIIKRYEHSGFEIVAMKLTKLSKKEAQSFYAVHNERPFFNGLVDFMTSGPIVALCLKAENAVKKNRDLMGATNPKDAAAGTLRKDFATDIEKNAVHGSDSVENAKNEIAFFFSGIELAKAKA